MAEIKKLKIDDVVANPNQPRKHFDEQALRELADSIKTDGLQEPILARPKNRKYEIVQGERRWRAHKLAGLGTIPAKVREVGDEDAFHLAVIENIQREQLTPIEEAQAFQRYVEMGYTHEQIAKKVSKSRTYVTTRLRMLKLVTPLQDWIAEGRISEGHVKQLLKAETLASRLCGEHHFSKGMGESPFERFQRGFMMYFKEQKKITVNDVCTWIGILRENLLYPMVAVFNGHYKVVLGYTDSFDITARGYCILGDLQIQNITEDDIEFLLQRTLDRREWETEDSNNLPRWEIYKTYDELKKRMFKDGRPDWPVEEKERRERKLWNKDTDKPDMDAFDELWDTMFVFHENVSRDT